MIKNNIQITLRFAILTGMIAITTNVVAHYMFWKQFNVSYGLSTQMMIGYIVTVISYGVFYFVRKDI